MNGACHGKRGAGMGQVSRRGTKSLPYDVRTPGVRGTRGEFICFCETRHAGEKALNAWWMVRALAALGGASQLRAAS